MVAEETTESGSGAANAALRLFGGYAPEAAEQVAPFVRRLFAALKDGHTFIWLDGNDAAALGHAAPIVGVGTDAPLVLDGRRLFLGRMWQLERDLAKEIVRLATAKTAGVDWMRSRAVLAEWFAGENSKGQRDAAALALLQPFMLISGGPGTGKTTTVAKLLGLLCLNSGSLPRIGLAAPTGKAAAHMAKALHRALAEFPLPEDIRAHLADSEGKTVHRLLKLRPPQMQPVFGKEKPLPLDVLIVDEASMLDVSLMLQLLRAVPDGCRVVLLGDENQLPSVGAGAVLVQLAQPTLLDEQTAADLAMILPDHGFQTASQPAPLSQNTARLVFSHRFGEDSGIGCLARAVVNGEAESAWQQFERFPQELSVCRGGSREQAERLYGLHAAYWQAVDGADVAAAFRHQADVVVLAARRSEAEAFNEAYRQCLQRHGRAAGDGKWFAGQVLMIERNDYALDLFNGDIGLVLADPDHERQDSDTQALAAYFPMADGFKKMALSRLPEHHTAFAMTVHKSQGSEYRDVWLLAEETQNPEEDGRLLDKALLYTAITRARARFVFWGSQAVFQTACTSEQKRNSALRPMIAEAFG